MFRMSAALLAAALAATPPVARAQGVPPVQSVPPPPKPVAARPKPAAAPAEPTTLVLPLQTVTLARAYLGARPHDEVAGIIGQIEACARAQIPVQGSIRDTGGCPAVTAEMRARREAEKPEPREEAVKPDDAAGRP